MGVHLSEPTWGLVQSACHARESPAPLARVGLPALATSPGEGGFGDRGDCCERSHPKSLPLMKRVQHTNTFSMRSSATIGLFYRDLGARWLPGGGHRKRKTVETRKRVGGFARCAPLNICPDWKGLGMQCDFMAGKTAVSARSWDSHNRSTQTTLHTTPRRKQK